MPPELPYGADSGPKSCPHRDICYFYFWPYIQVGQPGLPEGVLTSSNRNALMFPGRAVPPKPAGRFPQHGASSPSSWTSVPQPLDCSKNCFSGLSCQVKKILGGFSCQIKNCLGGFSCQIKHCLGCFSCQLKNIGSFSCQIKRHIGGFNCPIKSCLGGFSYQITNGFRNSCWNTTSKCNSEVCVLW